MAILFTDGFDYYNANSGVNGELVDISSRYITNTNYTTYFSTYPTGYDGVGKALTVNASSNANNNFRLSLPTGFTKFTIGGHVYMSLAGRSSEREIFTVQAASGTWLALTTSTASGTNYFSVRCSVNGSLGLDTRISNFTYAATTWYYLEFRAEVIGNTDTINVQVYINGQLMLDKTGVAFSAGPYQWNYYYLGSPWLYGGLSNSTSVQLDNFYVSDGEVLGPINIRTVVPTADTSFKAGVASNGSDNYAMINDISSASMNSNVFFANNGDVDQYEIGDLSLINPNDTVIGLQPLIFATVTRDATQRMTSSLVSSGTESTVSSQPALAVSTPTVITPGVIRTDPSTSTDWTVSSVNNARLKITRTV